MKVSPGLGVLSRCSKPLATRTGKLKLKLNLNKNKHSPPNNPTGDQIIEWNGVNLCNRSDGEVQQILFSQFTDDEVEIIYLNRNKFVEAYGGDHERAPLFDTNAQGSLYEINDTFDAFSRINKQSSGSKKVARGGGGGGLFTR